MSLPPPDPDIVWTNPLRANHFDTWLSTLTPAYGLRSDTLRLASADASFRRYFRIQSTIDSIDCSRIIMDAPPDKENNQAFVKVAALMQQARVPAPQVLAWDETHGFMLLTDLGARTMMQVMTPTNTQANASLYQQAVDVLIDWQKASRPGVLPPYDGALLKRELDLFSDWYLVQHRGLRMDGVLRQMLDDTYGHIIRHNLSWPQVFVHRDFMPRNLIVPDDWPNVAPNTGLAQRLGVLDFQDAVFGPITYDIACLVRDSFVSWDDDFCQDIVRQYHSKARKAGLPVGDSFDDFDKGVRWMGLQRHLKVAGIFARLTLRDGKSRYLADTPRFLDYICATCRLAPLLTPLLRLVDRLRTGQDLPKMPTLPEERPLVL